MCTVYAADGGELPSQRLCHVASYGHRSRGNLPRLHPLFPLDPFLFVREHSHSLTLLEAQLLRRTRCDGELRSSQLPRNATRKNSTHPDNRRPHVHRSNEVHRQGVLRLIMSQKPSLLIGGQRNKMSSSLTHRNTVISRRQMGTRQRLHRAPRDLRS